ncbi:MAG TPA: ROK family protein [Tepidisphaeraceae bacterium]|nr:ROK family protein [Tepidisphaeraceae bacterium]
MSQITLGIDVGGTTVKAAALCDGQVLWTSRSARYNKPTAEQLVAAIRETCIQLADPIEGVGLCVPGILDEQKQHVAVSANIPGLVGVPLRDLVSRAVNSNGAVPVVVNDANATAYDIYSTRKPTGRLLVLAIGTGVGMSVVDDGKPLFVDGESPGHIGQVDVSIEGDRVIGPDGGRGGVEAYVGTAALRKRYGSNAAAKIRPGDAPFKALVRTLRICHAIYRPHHICLAGGTGIRLAPLIDPLKRATEVELTKIARKPWTLSVADSDFHAAAGAARIATSADWPRAAHPV